MQSVLTKCIFFPPAGPTSLNYINHPTLGSHVISFPACILWVRALLILWVCAVLFPTIEGEIPEGGVLRLEAKMTASLWATNAWAWYS